MAIVQSDGVLKQTMYPTFAAPMGSVTWYSGLTADLAAIYERHRNVRTVVDFFARNIAQLPLNVFERVSDEERRRLTGHPVMDFVYGPNPGIRMTRYHWIESMVADRKIYGNHFSLKVRNPVDGSLRVFRLPPQLMVPADGAGWMYADRWQFMGVREQPIFSHEDLIHLRGYNPIDPRFGMSPLMALLDILQEDEAASNYRRQFWQQGARISGVIERPASGSGTPRWSEAAKANFMAEWQATYSGVGPGSGGTPLLEDGMTFKEVSFSAKDSEYIAARRLSREEVASAFHLSPLFVGILDNANFSNVKEQHKHLYQDAFGPDLTAIEEELAMSLLPEFEDLDRRIVFFKFDLTEKLEGSFEEQAAVLQAAVGGPYMSRNEARKKLNLPPIDGADELIVPLNVIEGGQASPQDSAPDPGQASRSAKALTKADEELPEEVQGWQEEHEKVLAATFERQKEALVRALGGGQSVEAAWSEARWNRELQADLLELATAMSTDVAQKLAEELGGSYDPEAPGVNELLEENSRIAAENINYTTKSELEALDNDDDFMDAVRNVFAVAASSRAAQIAVSRVTSVGNFARHEAASQTGQTYKIWRVRSSTSRHPRLNGEKVRLNEEFSNGAMWPGDHRLKDDQRSGCKCDLQFSKE